MCFPSKTLRLCPNSKNFQYVLWQGTHVQLSAVDPIGAGQSWWSCSSTSVPACLSKQRRVKCWLANLASQNCNKKPLLKSQSIAGEHVIKNVQSNSSKMIYSALTGAYLTIRLLLYSFMKVWPAYHIIKSTATAVKSILLGFITFLNQNLPTFSKGASQ